MQQNKGGIQEIRKCYNHILQKNTTQKYKAAK